MPGKLNFLFVLLHLYIISYLVAIVVGASDTTMLVMHILAPFIVVSTVYQVLKTFALSAADKKEGYKVL
jgi:hypothetical protein